MSPKTPIDRRACASQRKEVLLLHVFRRLSIRCQSRQFKKDIGLLDLETKPRGRTSKHWTKMAAVRCIEFAIVYRLPSLQKLPRSMQPWINIGQPKYNWRSRPCRATCHAPMGMTESAGQSVELYMRKETGTILHATKVLLMQQNRAIRWTAWILRNMCLSVRPSFRVPNSVL